jgi:predicted nucleotidyltransferase
MGGSDMGFHASGGIEETLAKVSSRLAAVSGVSAVTLGGSRATGTAHDDSDIDLGLFYSRANRPDFDAILECVSTLDDRGRPDGYGGYGEWGPWINGGVWLRVDGFKTDVLLREIERVRDVLDQCANGDPQIHYQVGHPHGFCTTIYAGEVTANIPLHDPDGVLPRLRAIVDPYPDRLAEALIGRFGWEAKFSIDIARSAADRGDVHYVSGCAFRTVACLNQVLFAANRRYVLNEKGATVLVDNFPVAPAGYHGRVNEALGRLSPDPYALRQVLDLLDQVRSDTVDVIDRA